MGPAWHLILFSINSPFQIIKSKPGSKRKKKNPAIDQTKCDFIALSLVGNLTLSDSSRHENHPLGPRSYALLPQDPICLPSLLHLGFGFSSISFCRWKKIWKGFGADYSPFCRGAVRSRRLSSQSFSSTPSALSFFRSSPTSFPISLPSSISATSRYDSTKIFQSEMVNTVLD